jgi:hypothetical protein
VDEDGDGVLGDHESPLSHDDAHPGRQWVVYLDGNLNGVRDDDELFTVTETDGTYQLQPIDCCEPITVSLEATDAQQKLWDVTSPDGSVYPSPLYTMELKSGEKIDDLNFGVMKGLQPGSVNGLVWVDEDGDGVLGDHETPLSHDGKDGDGWVVYLDENLNGVRDDDELFTVTETDGTYQLQPIDCCEPITVSLEATDAQQKLWDVTSPDGGVYPSPDSVYTMELESGGKIDDLNFGVMKPAAKPTAKPTAEPTDAPLPTLAPTVEPTVCEMYCCENQLVMWHIPGSEGHACDDFGEPVAIDTDLENCNKLCVLDPTCLYFSVDDDGSCFNGEFCGNEMKEHAELLPIEENNPGGIYQLYCAMEGSYDKTCSGTPSTNEEVGFLTVCFDKCAKEEGTVCSTIAILYRAYFHSSVHFLTSPLDKPSCTLFALVFSCLPTSHHRLQLLCVPRAHIPVRDLWCMRPVRLE